MVSLLLWVPPPALPLIHWTGLSDIAVLVIADGPGTPVPGRANQMIPPRNLPVGMESEGTWSTANVSTWYFSVFPVKGAEPRLLGEKL